MGRQKFTVSSFKTSKRENHKISMLTAYDYSTAKLLDEVGIDTILVGDSLGMVILGYENTLQVTMTDMLHHTKAVVRGTKHTFVIGDMPFLSYHISVVEAVRNAGRFIQEGGADAIKLEGGKNVLPQIKAIVAAQIPVIGHLGLTPQSVNLIGGFKVQGKNKDEARKLLEEALLLEAAGVCAIVLECIPEKLATLISQKLSIPTIGIGAGKGCDGQVLVTQDMLGMFKGFSPKFVKHYADVGEIIQLATKNYISEIQDGVFPDIEHTFKIDEQIIENLY